MCIILCRFDQLYFYFHFINLKEISFATHIDTELPHMYEFE